MENMEKVCTLVKKVLSMYKSKNDIKKMSYEDINNAIFANDEVEMLIIASLGQNPSGELLDSITDSNVRTAIDMVIDKNKVNVVDEYSIPETAGELDISKASGLDLYFKDMARYNLLSPDEEIMLFKRVQLGDEEARKEIAARNQRLVVSIAKHYHYENTDDFLCTIQDGNLGLMKSIDKFEVDKGFKFSTYATWWIRQSISRERENTMYSIRIPVYLVNNLRKMRAFVSSFYELNQKTPSTEDIAKGIGVDEDMVIKLLTLPTDLVSLNEKINNEDEDTELGDLVVSSEANIEEEAIDRIAADELRKVMNEALSEREVIVLSKRFGLDGGNTHTLEEVGNELGVTRERVRQIEAKALRKLRQPSASKKLRGFVK